MSTITPQELQVTALGQNYLYYADLANALQEPRSRDAAIEEAERHYRLLRHLKHLLEAELDRLDRRTLEAAENLWPVDWEKHSGRQWEVYQGYGQQWCRTLDIWGMVQAYLAGHEAEHEIEPEPHPEGGTEYIAAAFKDGTWFCQRRRMAGNEPSPLDPRLSKVARIKARNRADLVARLRAEGKRQPVWVQEAK